MIWSSSEVRAAICVDSVAVQNTDALVLPLYSDLEGVGVGVDTNGAAVLVLPGQDELSSFITSAIVFDPWCDAVWVEQNRILPKRAVLRCVFDRGDLYAVSLIAGIFVGLLDLQSRFGGAGFAIHRLKELFGSGFGAGPERSALRGLLGELVTIYASPDRSRALETWHIEADGRFDFSGDSGRVEVKTSSSVLRQHRFNSRQLPAPRGVDVRIVSVLLAEVSVGASVADLCEILVDSLPARLSKKLADVVIETVGLPPAAIVDPQIDLAATVDSIRVFNGDDVPTPGLVPGVLEVQWTAVLDELHGSEGLESVELLATPGSSSS